MQRGESDYKARGCVVFLALTTNSGMSHQLLGNRLRFQSIKYWKQIKQGTWPNAGLGNYYC